jgi:small subunit ribosomal protein S3
VLLLISKSLSLRCSNFLKYKSGRNTIILSYPRDKIISLIESNNLKTQISSNRNLIINILEIKTPDSQAELIGDVIVALLEKRIAFRKAVKKGIARAQSVNVLGIKIQVAGRLNGAEMARTEWIREGRVPLQTLRADIDYAEKRANTIYGVLGIKVWLFNGEII